jgi:predicted phosphoribosyltransferase
VFLMENPIVLANPISASADFANVMAQVPNGFVVLGDTPAAVQLAQDVTDVLGTDLTLFAIVRVPDPHSIDAALASIQDADQVDLDTPDRAFTMSTNPQAILVIFSPQAQLDATEIAGAFPAQGVERR